MLEWRLISLEQVLDEEVLKNRLRIGIKRVSSIIAIPPTDFVLRSLSQHSRLLCPRVQLSLMAIFKNIPNETHSNPIFPGYLDH